MHIHPATTFLLSLSLVLRFIANFSKSKMISSLFLFFKFLFNGKKSTTVFVVFFLSMFYLTFLGGCLHDLNQPKPTLISEI